MTKQNENIHRTTMYLPVSVWNGIRLHAIRANKRYNEVIVKALKETFGEVDDLSEIKVTAGA